MKSPRIRHIIWLLLLWLMPGSFVVMGQNVNGESAQEAENVQDTIAPRYSVRKTVPGTLKDLSPHPADLQSPMKLRTEAEYDAKTDKYYIRTKLGNTEIGVPMILTPEEYLDWTLKQSMQSYYRQKNGEQIGKGKEAFDFMDMKFNLGPAEKLFGPGGVQIRTQGNAELSFGMTYKNVKNPSLPESQRKTLGFDFDEKININVNGKVGDKVNVERSMMMNGRLDGHIVQGHVDQTATCVDIKDADGSWYFTFKYAFDKEMAKRGYITVDKGSVTVNGVSLTVCNPTDDTFQVAIIPYTYEHTNFHTFVIGSIVNIEFDIIGKYISRMIV